MLMSSRAVVAKHESRLFQPCFKQQACAFHDRTPFNGKDLLRSRSRGGWGPREQQAHLYIPVYRPIARLQLRTTRLKPAQLHTADATQPDVSVRANPNLEQTSRPLPGVLDICPILKEPAGPESPIWRIAVNVTLGCLCTSRVHAGVQGHRQTSH